MRGRGRAGGRRDHDGLRRCLPTLPGQALRGLAARRHAGWPLDQVRPIRDELDERIEAFLAELVRSDDSAAEGKAWS